MWQTLAQIAVPIALDQGIKYLTKNNNPQPTTNSPNQNSSGWTSNTVGINPDDYRTGSSQYMDSLSPEQRQVLHRAMSDSGIGNQNLRDSDDYRRVMAGGTGLRDYSTLNSSLPINSNQNLRDSDDYRRIMAGGTGLRDYSTLDNSSLPINSQNAPNQKPGVYNDLLRPIVKETGNQLGKEAVGYFTTGETGPLMSLLGEGATYLAAML
jgi:hypothetical protein